MQEDTSVASPYTVVSFTRREVCRVYGLDNVMIKSLHYGDGAASCAERGFFSRENKDERDDMDFFML